MQARCELKGACYDPLGSVGIRWDPLGSVGIHFNHLPLASIPTLHLSVQPSVLSSVSANRFGGRATYLIPFAVVCAHLICHGRVGRRTDRQSILPESLSGCEVVSGP